MKGILTAATLMGFSEVAAKTKTAEKILEIATEKTQLTADFLEELEQAINKEESK